MILIKNTKFTNHYSHGHSPDSDDCPPMMRLCLLSGLLSVLLLLPGDAEPYWLL
jgi:hypothetical protein